ncbi:CPBP family intramembrane metalloprotease [Haloferax sp. MBLA0076]|uniref:CPBP family intramembrane metalloprotease n=1 Tax=Haloferax litoreum TaxID=2666140 RepID=A0A6A8GBP3_9EURY|nr:MULTISPECIES: CPBP family intramembrane glutamic endopeptidase [Haloferax]KAB1192174.1 CPBP family intramembrane metalloprotease [Haloferax sp. CBA1148]MRX20623.1 CPBP family intramembrane metalloprotease [Haloferax litoreum]
MTDWAAFTGFAGLVLVVLLSFAYVSRGVPHGDGASVSFDDQPTREASPDASDYGTPDDDRLASPAIHETIVDGVPSAPVVPTPDSAAVSSDLPTHLLIANVAVSQALLGTFLALGAWYAEIPTAALGIAAGDVPTKIGVGLALGVGLYAANRVGSSLSRQFGFTPDEALRESLTPETRGGWALLLFVALPLIAGFEELLFRGALVGAVAVGFDVSPWLMAAVSSAAFGAGHSAQGRLGIVVTGLLGFVLAAAFVLTGSLLVVVVAHYLVNALEFVGNELFGW